MQSRKLSTIAVLAALSTATSYALLGVPNVKFMDVIVFVAGFCMGPFAGALVGILSWSVYGVINPLGFSLPIWLAVMLTETIYGIAGGVAHEWFASRGEGLEKNRIDTYLFFGLLGVLLTFGYDIATNAVFGYVSNLSPLTAVIVGFVPLGIIHVASNAVFFGVGCVPAINAVIKVMRGGKNVISEK